jgi:hypothetical protein
VSDDCSLCGECSVFSESPLGGDCLLCGEYSLFSECSLGGECSFCGEYSLFSEWSLGGDCSLSGEYSLLSECSLSGGCSLYKQVKMPNNLYITCLRDSNPQPTKRHKCNFSWIKILITPNSIYLKKEVAR